MGKRVRTLPTSRISGRKMRMPEAVSARTLPQRSRTPTDPGTVSAGSTSICTQRRSDTGSELDTEPLRYWVRILHRTTNVGYWVRNLHRTTYVRYWVRTLHRTTNNSGQTLGQNSSQNHLRQKLGQNSSQPLTTAIRHWVRTLHRTTYPPIHPPISPTITHQPPILLTITHNPAIRH